MERPFLTKAICDGPSIQTPLYSKILQDNTEYDWLAFIDCDEFIVLKKHNNIKELIEEYKDRTDVIGLNWFMYGNLVIENGICKDFKEKSTSKDSWINGGFCIFNKKVLEFLTDKKEESFEEGLLTRLTQKNELAVYKHNGFWQCMDTNREAVMLNEIWKKGEAPWKTWN